MTLWTDYPIEALGDLPNKIAPVREVTLLSYDGDKYCKVLVEGVHEEIKRGYIYKERGSYGEVPCVTLEDLQN